MSVNIINLVNKKPQHKVHSAMEGLVTVSQAAKLRGVTRAAIHALITRDRLQSVEVFGRLFLYRNEVENFEKQTPGPKGPKQK